MSSWIIFVLGVFICHVSVNGVAENSNSKQLNSSPADQQFRSWMSCPERCKSCNSSTKLVNCVNCNLKEVPLDLPFYTERLLLNNNNIKVLRESAFSTVPHLKYLQLNTNLIKDIENNSFLPLRHLVFLSIDINPTNNKVIANQLFCELRSTSIETLILSVPSKLQNITPNFFDCLRNTTIQNLTLIGNTNPFPLPNNALSHLKYLKELNIKQTKSYIFNTLALEFDTQLRKLILQENRISEIPVFFKPETKKGLFPNLQYLDLSRNSIQVLFENSFRGLLALEFLFLSHNNIKYIGNQIFFSLNSLKKLYLNDNRLQNLNPDVFNSSSIKFLQLENNNFKMGYQNKRIFQNIKNIEVLYLSGRFNTMEGLFNNITSLKVLSLKKFSVKDTTVISKNAFSGLYSLQTLYITNSKLSTLDSRVFRDLNSLQKLYLFSNQISIVNSSSFPQHVWQSIQLLSVADNSFVCTCELLWFIDWVRENKNKIENIKAHRCKYPENVPITNAMVSADLCIRKPTSVVTKVACGLSMLITVTAVVVSAIIRHRWYLRSKLFHLTVWMQLPKAAKWNTEVIQEYTYDVFVSYHSEDSQWVNTVLVNELEENSDSPFKLCLFERDWLPGHSIIDCIGESIEQSRKILLIVTNAFAESPWCQLELTMAQVRLLETNKDNVIIAIMEDIESANITPTLALEMKRRVYLQWTEDALCQKLFWQKLKHSLASNNTCIRQAMPPKELI